MLVICSRSFACGLCHTDWQTYVTVLWSQGRWGLTGKALLAKKTRPLRAWQPGGLQPSFSHLWGRNWGLEWTLGLEQADRKSFLSEQVDQLMSLFLRYPNVHVERK